MHLQRVKSRVAKEDFPKAARSRITLENGVDISLEASKPVHMITPSSRLNRSVFRHIKCSRLCQCRDGSTIAHRVSTLLGTDIRPHSIRYRQDLLWPAGMMPACVYPSAVTGAPGCRPTGPLLRDRWRIVGPATRGCISSWPALARLSAGDRASLNVRRLRRGLLGSPSSSLELIITRSRQAFNGTLAQQGPSWSTAGFRRSTASTRASCSSNQPISLDSEFPLSSVSPTGTAK